MGVCSVRVSNGARSLYLYMHASPCTKHSCCKYKVQVGREVRQGMKCVHVQVLSEGPEPSTSDESCLFGRDWYEVLVQVASYRTSVLPVVFYSLQTSSDLTTKNTTKRNV